MGYKNNRVGYQKELLTSRAVIKKVVRDAAMQKAAESQKKS